MHAFTFQCGYPVTYLFIFCHLTTRSLIPKFQFLRSLVLLHSQQIAQEPGRMVRLLMCVSYITFRNRVLCCQHNLGVTLNIYLLAHDSFVIYLLFAHLCIHGTYLCENDISGVRRHASKWCTWRANGTNGSELCSLTAYSSPLRISFGYSAYLW